MKTKHEPSIQLTDLFTDPMFQRITHTDLELSLLSLISGRGIGDATIVLDVDDLGAKAIAMIFQSGKARQGIRLYVSERSQMSAEGEMALAQALQSSNAPENLGIRFDNKPNINLFADVLLSGKAPKDLTFDFKNNALSIHDLETLALALESGHAPKGLTLGLSHNNLGGYAFQNQSATPSIQALARAIQSGKAPEQLTLDLSSTSVHDPDAKMLAKAIKSGKAPKGLNLNLSNKNFISFEGAKALAQAIGSGKAPEQLQINLSSKKEFPGKTDQGWILDETGTLAILAALESGKAPKGLLLDFSQTFFDYPRIKALAHAIRSGKAPENLTIRLRFNQLDEIGARILAKAIQSTKAPKGLTLDVSNNAQSMLRKGLGDEGAIAFAEALQSGFAPEDLTIDLSKSSVGEAGIDALNEAIQSDKAPLNLKLRLGLSRVKDISSLMSKDVQSKSANARKHSMDPQGLTTWSSFLLRLTNLNRFKNLIVG